MNESVIQNQNRLLTFKAVKVEMHAQKMPKSFNPTFDLKLTDLLFPDSPKLFAKVFSIELTTPSLVLRLFAQVLNTTQFSNAVPQSTTIS